MREEKFFIEKVVGEVVRRGVVFWVEMKIEGRLLGID